MTASAIETTASVRGTMIVLIGLPGSGKSELQQQLKNELDAVPFDDYHAGGTGLPQGALRYSELVAALRAGRTVVVADVAFCSGARLHHFLFVLYQQVPDLLLDLRYYSNARAHCEQNARDRDAATDRGSLQGDLEAIAQFSPDYTPPRVSHLQVYGEV